MSQMLIQAGSSVESLCKKCKTITDHHVVVMDGDKIAKVECKVCSSRHAYQSPKAEPKVKAPKTPKEPRKGVAAARKQAATIEAQWEKAVATENKPVSYSMTTNFRVGDVMNHPTFGLGQVQKFLNSNTIEVIFRDGMKNLRCAHKK